MIGNPQNDQSSSSCDASPENKYCLNDGTRTLSWVSGLNSYSMGIIIADILSSVDSFGVGLGWLATLRVTGEVFGYFARILAGFISDYSRKYLRTLLLFGYSMPLLFKIMFFLASLSYFSVEVKCLLFMVANILDKMFNIWRDIPRDIAIVELSTKDNLQQNIALRKMMACLGTAFGSLTAILLNPLKKYGVIYIYIVAFIPCIIGIYLLYKNSQMYSEIVVINKEIKTNSQYSLFDNTFVFVGIIATVILLFFGKLNEIYIFNAIAYKNYNTQWLYTLFHFCAPLTLYVTFKYKELKGLSLLLCAVGGVFLSIILLLLNINIITIILLCLAYSIYNSMLDTILISTIMKRFNRAKYNALLLSIVNVSMGVGSLLSIQLIKFFQTIWQNEYSIVGSLIPIGLGLILIMINKKDYN